ncbi:MAG: hypothetical protein ACE1Z0_09605 [Acidimicrobiia bacterium]
MGKRNRILCGILCCMELAQARRSWHIALRSSHRSDRTLEVYLLALDQLIEWLTDEGHSMEVTEITPNDLRLFIVHMLAAPASMDPRWFVPPGTDLPETISMPTPRTPREDQQEQWVRDLEIDPDLYWPPDAKRGLTQTFPGITLDPRKMLAQRGIELP